MRSLLVAGITIVVSAISTWLQAQPQLSFEHLSLKHGLSQSVPNDIYQDREGFLWVATQDGLNRYDGYSFRIFKHAVHDTATISHSWVWKVCEDANGALWAATWNGINRYDKQQNIFIRYNGINAGSVTGTRTNIVFNDSRNRLWVGTWGDGLHLYNNKGDRFEPVEFLTSQSPLSKLIRCVFEDRDGRLWIGTFGAGLFYLDEQENKLIKHGPLQMENERVTSITQDADANFWIGTNENGIIVWNAVQQSVKRIHRPQLNDDQITKLLTDNKGNVWVGTREGGINLYSNEVFSHWNHEASDFRSVAGSQIFSIFQDREGIVWIGSNGLSKYDDRRKKFFHITHLQNVPTTLSGKVVRTVFEDSQSRLWIGIEGGGLNLLDSRYNVIKVYRSKNDDPNTISNNDVRAIVEDKDRSFLIATHGGGLNRFFPETGKFSRYSNREDYPAEAIDIQDLHLDDSGLLWIGTVRNGLLHYNTKSDRFIRPTLTYGDTVPVSSAYVNRIDTDNSGHLWVSGWGGGFSVIRPSSDTIIRYLHDKNRLDALANDIVYCVYQDKRKRIWVATAGGLNLLVHRKKNVFNSFNESLKLYTEAQGLSNNVVYGILEDDAGQLWLSTNYGLSCFNPDTEEFKNYHEDDGLQNEEFNANAFLKTRDGRLIFGGINGLNIFTPRELFLNTNKPPVVITSMNIFERPLKTFQNEPVRLKYNDNFVSFEFVALDFMAPQRNAFAYKLEGLESDWVMAGQRRYASYTDLKPGTYMFRVIASNNDGVWNNEGATILFTIASPFWVTWWFITLMALVAIAILYLIYRYRVEQKLKVERLRTKIASDLHDEVGSNLTRISIYADLLNNGVEEQQKQDYLRNIRETSREVVSTMSDIVWSIDNRSDKLGDLLLRMKDFAAQILSPKNIEFEFVVHTSDDKILLSPQVKQNLYLIYKEALHNIVKHAQAKCVSIRVEQSMRNIVMQISDDGVGFLEDESRKGNGLRSMRKRAADIHAQLDLTIQDGTSIRLDYTIKV